MIRRLFALIASVLMFIPRALADNITSDYSPEGYANEICNGVGMSCDTSLLFGGGNPISMITDPMIAWINQALAAFGLGPYGFIVFYTITILMFGAILPVLVIGIVFSYIGYAIGQMYDLEFTFILMIGLFIMGSILGWKIGHGSAKFARLRKIFLGLLILLLLALAGLWVLSFFGITLVG